MKPSGLCSKCEFVNVCNVDSQTHAKVIQCVYANEFAKGKDNVSPKKTKRL